jgi:hypothetical protein
MQRVNNERGELDPESREGERALLMTKRQKAQAGRPRNKKRVVGGGATTLRHQARVGRHKNEEVQAVFPEQLKKDIRPFPILPRNKDFTREEDLSLFEKNKTANTGRDF